MTTKADNILDQLFGSSESTTTKTIDQILQDVETPKKKKRKTTLMDEAIATPRFHAPSMQTVAIVAIRIVETCLCCGKSNQHMNKHLLTKKVDKNGNMHETRYISSSDATNPKIPRIIEQIDTKIAMCEYCFLHDVPVKPVMDEEAKDDIAPNGDNVGQKFKSNQELEDQVDAIWAKIQEM